MEDKRVINGTYSESERKDEWYGTYYQCNECGFTFMVEFDLPKCSCPACGRYLIWDKADDDNE